MRILLILIIIGTIAQVVYGLNKQREAKAVKRQAVKRRSHLTSVPDGTSGDTIALPAGTARGHHVLSDITDPLQAAGVLLVQVAAFDGDISPAQKDRIVTSMQHQLGADIDAAQSHYSFGRMAIGQVTDITAGLPALVKPIRKNCTVDEMRTFVNMMLDVAAAESDVSPAQEVFIDQTQLALLK